ncbi:glutaredoxin family protein [Frateuria aurantia]|uniref:Glutaredoxin-like domain (DUF836) n=1 Tax=Frateuria aurantia (strain ATCC 33424 / DSM 6220 / KCTC 2777 / LMG 1558 / NBRC 3245 / NCIMB 13370) TaxID=767434 RepID=H8KZA2_FRAAD|nr:glutaredoxin family protein [Frateuria aurantia]AFC85206.1 Glutaredoxin-like domain (DUF836) [Frateuria aurantia DSM 6220]
MPKPFPVETAPAWDLYIRDHCGLCDQALAVLAAFGFPAFRMVWIDDDPGLEARYGERIPVLSHRGGGAALDWPFEVDALQRLRERGRD